MNARKLRKTLRADGQPLPPDAVVEVAVLLEARLLLPLATAATDQGVTVGVLVRRLIRDFLADSKGTRSTLRQTVPSPSMNDAIV